MLNATMSDRVQPESAVRYAVGDADARPWGRWEVLAIGDNFIVKRIRVNPGARLSLQRHQHRSETWTIVCGYGAVTRDEEKIAVAPGDVVQLPRGCVHRIENMGLADLIFVEVQFGAVLDESDIERLQDDYMRC